MHGLAHHILNWGALTRDCWVLNTVQGYQIESQHCTGVPDRVLNTVQGYQIESQHCTGVPDRVLNTVQGYQIEFSTLYRGTR